MLSCIKIKKNWEHTQNKNLKHQIVLFVLYIYIYIYIYIWHIVAQTGQFGVSDFYFVCVPNSFLFMFSSKYTF